MSFYVSKNSHLKLLKIIYVYGQVTTIVVHPVKIVRSFKGVQEKVDWRKGSGDVFISDKTNENDS